MSIPHVGCIHGSPKAKPGSGPMEESIYAILRAVSLYVHRPVFGYYATSSRQRSAFWANGKVQCLGKKSRCSR